MLVVRYNVSEEKLRSRFEPAVHYFCFAFGYLPAISGIFLDLYNAAGLWCWIAPLPQDCLDTATYGETTCTRGDNAWIYRWAFYFGPLWFVIVLVTLIMIYVYRFVRQKEKRAREELEEEEEKRRGVGGRKQRTSMIKAPTKPAAGRRGRPTLLKDLSQQIERDVSNGTLLRVSVQMANKMKSSTSLSRIDAAEAEYVMETIEQYTSAAHQSMDVNRFGCEAVFRQSVLYTLAFYACFLFATINRLVYQVTGKTYFPLQFLHVLLIPLQGFFNVLIYRYGFFLRLKQRHPNLNRWELLGYTWRWSFMGPPPGLKTERPTMNDSLKSALEFVESTHNVSPSRKEAENGGTQTSSNEQPLMKEDDSGDEQVSVDLDENENGTALVNVPVLEDAFDTPAAPVQSFVADMMYSYSEFPNLASEQGMVVVSASFPTMVCQFSVSNFVDTPQAYPTFSNF